MKDYLANLARALLGKSLETLTPRERKVIEALAEGDPVAPLIEDPWKTIPCPEGPELCVVEFEDPSFEALGRDLLYYVRAIQEPSPTVNGDQLRCERDETGQCIRVNPCLAREPTAFDDDCLADVSERAWSSPIFVDWR